MLPAGQAGLLLGVRSSGFSARQVLGCYTAANAAVLVLLTIVDRHCFGTLFWFCWLTSRTHTQHACAIILPRLAAPSALNSLPVLRHHLSEEFEHPVGVTPGAVTGVSAPHRHARSDVRSLCAQAIYLDFAPDVLGCRPSGYLARRVRRPHRCSAGAEPC